MELKIGETIRALRKQQGRTQENVADALDITFQAVSRWESGLAYPDMELIPSIANYFGVSIDELFGYDCERDAKIDALVETIREKNKVNNGEDICIDECISLAREGLVEFPGNEKLLLCLAMLLYNAGFARYGEHHLTDADGYDVFDVERHRTYAEWKEAKHIYEKLVRELADGAQKQEAILRLTQLYADTGETEKSMALIEHLPDVSGCADLLVLNAYDGRRRAEAYEESLSKLLCVCANLMCSTVMLGREHVSNDEAICRIRNGIALLDMDLVDSVRLHDDLTYHEKAGLYLYLSVFLWRGGDHNGAFEALDRAYDAARMHDRYAAAHHDKHMVAGLPTYWPTWCVPDYEDVESDMKSDPRWDAWVQKCTES